MDDAEAFGRLAAQVVDPDLRAWLRALETKLYPGRTLTVRLGYTGAPGEYIVGTEAPTIWTNAGAGAGALAHLALNVNRWVGLGPLKGQQHEVRAVAVGGRRIVLTAAARTRGAWSTAIERALESLEAIDPVLAGIVDVKATRNAPGVHLRVHGDRVQGMLRLRPGHRIDTTVLSQ